MDSRPYAKLYLPGLLSTALLLFVFAATYALFRSAYQPIDQIHRTLESAQVELRSAMEALSQDSGPTMADDLSELRAGLARAAEALDALEMQDEALFGPLASQARQASAQLDAVPAGDLSSETAAHQRLVADLTTLIAQSNDIEMHLIGEHESRHRKATTQTSMLLLAGAAAALAVGLLNTFYLVPRFAIRPLLGLLQERAAQKEALRQSAERFRSYIEHAPIGVVVADKSGRYIDANQAAADDLGYTREELLQRTIADVLHPSGLKAGLAHFESVKAEAHSAGEFILQRADGAPFHAEVHAAHLGNEQYLGFHVNLTERRKAAAVVLRQAALDSILAEVSQSIVAGNYDHAIPELITLRARELTGSTLGWILVEGPEGNLIHCHHAPTSSNTQSERPSGASETLSNASPLVDLPRVEAPRFSNVGSLADTPPPPEIDVENMLAVPIFNDGHWQGQIVLANAPGGYSEADLSAAGQLAELFLLYRHGKRLREELDSSRKQFLHAQKMEAVGRLAGGVAHDFNNILGIIMGYTDYILSSEKAAENYREFLFSVRSAAERGADLTRQLLAFARKQTIQPRNLDLNESVGAMIKLLRRLAGEHVTMHWRPAEEQVFVTMDPSQLDQLLANLVVNARDAITGGGEITIATGSRDIDARSGIAPDEDYPIGRYAVLEVADNGSGMDKETLNQIFEPFFTTKPDGQGTGLGLATVHGIVHQNGGFVEADSTPGNGTRITIYIPQSTATVSDSVLRSAGRHAWPMGNETILLVDDQTEFLETCRRILECLGYTVLAASSGDQARNLATAHEKPIDLLITDLVMPGMNGKELWRALSKQFPGLRCLFMSGYTADILNEQDLLDTNVQFVHKPFSTSTLAEKIREILA